MNEAGFNEFQTPILTASSPEGARDFLVPSRIHPGKFYALPQAPQQYKQLLMMAGFDRYFQIAPCFRDEDPRADRLPGEFYQLDVEMSFVDAGRRVRGDGAGDHAACSRNSRDGKPVTQEPWPRIPYADAMRKYGSDKPDLRNPIEMQDVSEHFRGSGFKVFAGMIEKDPKDRSLGHSRAGRRFARLLRPHELLGARRGPARARLHLLCATRTGDRRARARSPRTSAPSAPRPIRAARPQGRRRRVLHRRRSGEVLQVRRRSPAPRSARS